MIRGNDYIKFEEKQEIRYLWHALEEYRDRHTRDKDFTDNYCQYIVDICCEIVDKKYPNGVDEYDNDINEWNVDRVFQDVFNCIEL